MSVESSGAVNLGPRIRPGSQQAGRASHAITIPIPSHARMRAPSSHRRSDDAGPLDKPGAVVTGFRLSDPGSSLRLDPGPSAGTTPNYSPLPVRESLRGNARAAFWPEQSQTRSRQVRRSVVDGPRLREFGERKPAGPARHLGRTNPTGSPSMSRQNEANPESVIDGDRSRIWRNEPNAGALDQGRRFTARAPKPPYPSCLAGSSVSCPRMSL